MPRKRCRDGGEVSASSTGCHVAGVGPGGAPGVLPPSFRRRHSPPGLCEIGGTGGRGVPFPWAVGAVCLNRATRPKATT
uniref:Uncharacterized protein n=1 Tax=Oryza meridionalis TaxID=40149 RepID=A0A0E0E2X4_9ORYZ